MDTKLRKGAHILLVEDSIDDAELTILAFEEYKISNKIHHVVNGESALSYLRKEDEYKDARTPDLVLLDLNLPDMDGQEILQEIRASEDLTHLPVVILSTSQDHIDIAKSYKLHANCYVTKPVGLDQFREIVRNLEHFWFEVVVLPKNA